MSGSIPNYAASHSSFHRISLRLHVQVISLQVDNMYYLRKLSKTLKKQAKLSSVYTSKCKFILKMFSKSKVVATLAVLNELKKIRDQSQNKKVYKKRRFWVKPLLIKRCDLDLESNLLKDLLWEDDDVDFHNFCRLNVQQFEIILQLVHEKIKKTDTTMRTAIGARTKLAVTLRFLATGDSFRSLEFLSRISKSTISIFIPEVLRAIYDALKNSYLKIPDTEDQWKDISDDFNNIWQFPHTLGALDGKHIRIKAPSNSGSQFFNFKGFSSIVLFASVDAHCRFTYVDVGCNGKASDSTIYQDGYLYNALTNGDLHIPKDIELGQGYGKKMPFFFIGDDAFRLDKNLMKPYSRCLRLNVPQEIFNYRLCRARMVVECAFGRLARRFCIFNRPIEVQTSTVDLVVLVCCVLHNYLTKKRPIPAPEDFENEIPPAAFSCIGPQENHTYKYACRTRDELSRYLTTEGNVDFQWNKINYS